MTDRFDPADNHHLQLKTDIGIGGGLLEIDNRQTFDNALRSMGFEVLATRDLAAQAGPSIPWFQPFVASGPSVTSFRTRGFVR